MISKFLGEDVFMGGIRCYLAKHPTEIPKQKASELSSPKNLEKTSARQPPSGPKNGRLPGPRRH